MIDIIKDILLNFKGIDGWKIVEKRVKSNELFFVKRDLDMNRAKNVHHFTVTVYRDFEDKGLRYKGSSKTDIHPTMKREEILKAVENSAYAAGFVRNPYYELVKPVEASQPQLSSNFSEMPLAAWMPKLTESIYKADVYGKGRINSSEFFLNKEFTRIINSEGVDVSYENYSGEIEFIVNWKESSEEVELYRNIRFANFDPELLTRNVNEMLDMSMGRAEAKPMPHLNKHMVVLTGEAVKDFFDYYYTQANAQFVYQGISTSKVNECIQRENVKRDKINIRLDPFFENSTNSAPYDQDGIPLNTVKLAEDGVLRSYWGDNQYSYYLNMKPTGNIKNLVVEGGEKSSESFKEKPYLELVSFSNFQMDPFTGDFGGEVRLGWYFDGEKTIPVTGGAVTGNVKEVQQEMYLSKEMQINNNFVGPKSVQFFNISVAGKE